MLMLDVVYLHQTLVRPGKMHEGLKVMDLGCVKLFVCQRILLKTE